MSRHIRHETTKLDLTYYYEQSIRQINCFQTNKHNFDSKIAKPKFK